MNQGIYRVTAEFLLRLDDEADARVIATDALHALVSETHEAGIGTEGDADNVLASTQAIVSMLVREILTRGSQSLGCTTVDNVKISNEQIE